MFGSLAINRILHRTSDTFLDALTSQGFVDKKDVEDLVGKSNSEIERQVLERKLCNPDDIAKAYSGYFGLPYVKLIGREVDPKILKLIPEEVAKVFRVVSFKLEGNVLHLAVGTPSQLQTKAPDILSELSRSKGITVSLSITTPEDIDWALKLYHQEESTALPSVQVKTQDKVNENNSASNLPKINLLDKNIPMEVLTKFPREVAEKYRMVVFDVDPPLDISPVPKKIKVAVLDPASPQVRDILHFIEKRNGINIEEYQADKESINRALSRYSDGGKGVFQNVVGDKPKLPSESESLSQKPSGLDDISKVPGIQEKISEPVAQVSAQIPKIESSVPIVENKVEQSTKAPDPKVTEKPLGEQRFEAQNNAGKFTQKTDTATPKVEQPEEKPAVNIPAPVFKPTPPVVVPDPMAAIKNATNVAAQSNVQMPKMFVLSQQKPPEEVKPNTPVNNVATSEPQTKPDIKKVDEQLSHGMRSIPTEPSGQSEKENKLREMQSIATTVIKPEEKRIKEGIVQPYGDSKGSAEQTATEPNKPVESKDVALKPPIPAAPINKGNPAASLSDTVPEVKQEDIRIKEGFLSNTENASSTEELEETDLDKFLAKAVESVSDLERIIKVGMVPEIVAAIVSLAVKLAVSDIHIEASEDNVRLRYRIDGILKDVIKMPLSMHAPLVSRIKILSKLKIDEQRIPQDGRFNVTVSQHEIDLRVSTLPTVHGEKVVMRILDKSAGIISLEELGVTGRGFELLLKNIAKPYGIILATGPTGSGKSTTLYAILQRISTPGVNVITLEDPVEYEIEGINQTQVKPQIGFTFAEGLRSVLRQDPNIIMVGEIRDLETASMATHAALTGHLVLSTLHTNDSAGALPRLINMGVEPFLITSSINCIIAQRLVRKVCQECKEPMKLPEAILHDISKELSQIKDLKVSKMDPKDLVFYHGKGCPACNNGYRGRLGIYEVLPMSEKIEELAVEKAPANSILQQALKEGMITMKQDGILKALKGLTTIDEVLRVTTSG